MPVESSPSITPVNGPTNLAGDDATPDTAGHRMSRSARWLRTRQFYDEQGPDAWASGAVPSYVTNNPYFADACADVVAAWLTDWHCRPRDPGCATGAGPFHIVELGAGTGRFAHLFLMSLESRLRGVRGSGTVDDRAGSIDAGIEWKYIATDASEKNRTFLREHVALGRLVEAGRLVTARLTPDDTVIRVDGRGEAGFEGEARTPLVVIANYVFDSLPQDCFIVRDGVLHECLIVEEDEADPAGARFRHQPVSRDCYGDPGMDAVLARYRHGPADRSILFPVDALRWIRALRRIAGDEMLLLVTDKGYLPGDIGEEGPPSVEVHTDSCSSMLVNFDALGGYVTDAGGEVWFGPKETDRLLTAAYTFGTPRGGLERVVSPRGGLERVASPRGGLEKFAAAFERSFERTSPMDVFQLVDQARRDPPAFDLPALLSLLRVSRYDPALFTDCFHVLLSRTRQAPAPMRSDVVSAVHQVSRNVYPVGPADPAAMLCGAFIAELGDPEDAERILRAAVDTAEPNPPALYLLGRCLARTNRATEGLAWIEKALAADPGFEDYLCFMGILPQREAKAEAERLRWETGA